jgi:hypothetical protein
MPVKLHQHLDLESLKADQRQPQRVNPEDTQEQTHLISAANFDAPHAVSGSAASALDAAPVAVLEITASLTWPVG